MMETPFSGTAFRKLYDEWIWGESLTPLGESIVPSGDLAVDRMPVSLAQRRIWMLDRLQPGNPALVLTRVCRLSGPLRTDVLVSTIEEIVRRHAMLRWTFLSSDDDLEPAIFEKLAVELPVIDLGAFPDSGKAAEARRVVVEEGAAGIELTGGPLFRAKLVRLAPEQHWLLFSAHSIVADEGSLDVVLQELWILFEAFSHDRPSPLPELSMEYADFADWQTRWFDGDRLALELDFWRGHLGDTIEGLPLPYDRLVAIVPGEPETRCMLALDKTTTDALRALSREEGATLFMSLLTAFSILLHRYASRENIFVGCRTSGRTEQTRELVGPFANTLVFHTQVDGGSSFKALIRRVRSQVVDSLPHRATPVERLLQAFHSGCDPARSPLCQIGFRMFGPDAGLPSPSGLTVELVEGSSGYAGHELALEVLDTGGALQLYLVYRADLFSHERMTDMLGQFRQLLTEIIRDPAQPIDAYSLITTETCRHLPDPRHPIAEPLHLPITTQFPSWSTRPPYPPAIIEGSRSWTYADLADRARVTARALVVVGVARGDVVAVAGVAGFALIAGMMGALASGGVLLTLDRKVPTRRQQLMLERASAKYLVYAGSIRPEDEWMRSSLKCLCIDAVSGRVQEEQEGSTPKDIVLPSLGPDDPAYLFFTSGSTGEPKGILGRHKGLAHFLAWQRETFSIGPADRSAQLTGLSFDVVLRDIFTPLTGGATLCIPAEADRLDPVRLLSWMERERISMLHTVPSVAQSWLRNVPASISLTTLRWAFFAGEPLTDTLIRRWREAFPAAGRIVNLYGPTETTLAKCFFLVPENPLPGVQPVGSPLPETQALVMGPNHRECGIGEVGEIVLRTPFRSLGYIDSDESERKRFVRNPFRDDEGDQLYLTGDRGRYRPDGSLEILGRVDHQVKLRGVRIELGGIERLLVDYPGVWSAVAMIREDSPGDPRLVAYVMATAGQSVTGQELIQHLRQKLPDAMVPAACIVLDNLPLNANGKVDRRALPPPEAVQRLQAALRLAPGSEVERALARIWKDVLRIDDPGMEDNFFDLGGHSLLVVEVQAALREQLGREVDIVDLFEYPTIGALARRLGELESSLPGGPQAGGRAQLRKRLMRQRRRRPRQSCLDEA